MAMAANDTQGWSELLDVALFEADGITLRQRIKHATKAIHSRMEELLKDENAGSISERIALRNALSTLADLQKIAYARKASGSVRRESGKALGG